MTTNRDGDISPLIAYTIIEGGIPLAVSRDNTSAERCSDNRTNGDFTAYDKYDVDRTPEEALEYMSYNLPILYFPLRLTPLHLVETIKPKRGRIRYLGF